MTTYYSRRFHLINCDRGICVGIGLLLFSFVLLFSPQCALSHPDLELQIEAVTVQIEANPGDLSLYLTRGELYRRHCDYKAALHDFEKLSHIDTDEDIVEFLIGRTLQESGEPEKAITTLKKFLNRNPLHSFALLVYARSLSSLNRVDEASDCFKLSIKNAPVKAPDLYIEWSGVFLKTDNERLENALNVLREGITQLGPVISLVDHAVSLQQRLGDFTGAIHHIEMLPVQIQAAPMWLTKRADCVHSLGNLEQATLLYHKALRAIAALPHARRELPALRELKIYINTKS